MSLTFLSSLREGAEGIVFLFGLSITESVTSIPLAVIMGIICGCLVGFIMLRAGDRISLKYFFTGATIILYMIAAGLFSMSVFQYVASP